jgi:hypothetical protein
MENHSCKGLFRLGAHERSPTMRCRASVQQGKGVAQETTQAKKSKLTGACRCQKTYSLSWEADAGSRTYNPMFMLAGLFGARERLPPGSDGVSLPSPSTHRTEGAPICPRVSRGSFIGTRSWWRYSKSRRFPFPQPGNRKQSPSLARHVELSLFTEYVCWAARCMGREATPIPCPVASFEDPP